MKIIRFFLTLILGIVIGAVAMLILTGFFLSSLNENTISFETDSPWFSECWGDDEYEFVFMFGTLDCDDLNLNSFSEETLDGETFVNPNNENNKTIIETTTGGGSSGGGGSSSPPVAGLTVGVFGDSETTGSVGGVSKSMVHVFADKIGAVAVNKGRDGSCLTKTCHGKPSFISEYESRMTEKVIYYAPHMNDIVNGFVPEDYAEHLETIIRHALNNSELLTGSNQPSTHPDYETNDTFFARMKTRELAVLYEIPYLEWAYFHNWNTSYLYDEIHMNQEGHSFWGEKVHGLYEENISYHENNWSYYATCNYIANLLNRSIVMPEANCFLNTSADWLVIEDITPTSFHIARADKPFQYNITGLEDGYYKINIPNETSMITQTINGTLSFEFEEENLTVNYEGLCNGS